MQVEGIVDYISAELEGITESGEFWRYEEFLTEYSGTVLHTNHFLLTTARRNLLQFLCYSVPPSQVQISHLKAIPTADCRLGGRLTCSCGSPPRASSRPCSPGGCTAALCCCKPWWAGWTPAGQSSPCSQSVSFTSTDSAW